MNIKGIHVSIDGLRINSEISNLLDKYKIANYDDLNCAIREQNKEIVENYFLRKANNEFMQIFNSQGDFATLYNKYLMVENEKSKTDFNSRDIDKLVKMSDLPFFKLHPKLLCGFTYGYGPRASKREVVVSDYDKYNVEYAKIKMGEFRIRNGIAVPEIICYHTGIGEQKYNELLASINFYDKYVETLLEKYSDKENPFYYMQEEKLDLVKKSRKEIFTYLYNVGYELVVGDLKNVMNYLDSKDSRAKCMEPLYRKEEIIANYVTFDEALNIADEKVLNKFIVPYGRR